MDYIIISHEGLPYKLWFTFMIMLEVVSSLIYFVFAAYRRIENAVFSDIFESLFAVDILIHFILDIKSSHKTAAYTIRSFHTIVKKYVHGDLVYDIIPLIPLQLIQLENNAQNIFFLIKVLRLRRCLKKASIMSAMKVVNYFKERYFAYKYFKETNLHDELHNIRKHVNL